jgi:MFS transporter, SP family, sugar:H+ symporter
MFLGAICYLIGSALGAGAVNRAMLITGRVVLGFGVGFCNQVVPLFLAEIPPVASRGALEVVFQIAVNVGILSATGINVGTARLDDGWRISLGVFMIPAFVLLCGCFVLPETPHSLVERGRVDEARDVLKRLRSVEDIDDELHQVQKDALLVGDLRTQWRTLLSKPFAGEATVACSIAFLGQFTGINCTFIKFD